MKFTFKNKEDYEQQRQALLNEAENLINLGNIEEGNAKMEDIRQMDAEFEAAATAQANLKAMSGQTRPSSLPAPNNGVAATFRNALSEVDIFDSTEYRQAFMNYVLADKAIPAKFINADANTKTTDAGAIIPNTVLEKIIEKIETTGKILQMVTRTSYKGGLSIPTSSVKPVATWVNEGEGSDKQKKSTASISFTYHKLRCAVSVSLEVETTSLAVFEAAIINNISEAMIKALEESIINGTGEKQPKGILKEAVPSGQNIDVASNASITYADLCAAEGALPEEYENTAKWFMSKKTFMSIMALTDENGQPLARVNYGMNGKPERYLLGREVIVNPYTPTYAQTVQSDTVFAFIFVPEDYVLNTNLNITIKKYEDNNTDDKVTKGVMLADGKCVSTYSLVTMTKKA